MSVTQANRAGGAASALEGSGLRRAVAGIRSARRVTARHDALVVTALALVVLVLVVLTLCIGATITPIGDVLRVLSGQTVPGASFTVGELRLPRALGGLLVGLAFGAAGCLFQSVLRNTLASPDVIGISSGAGLAAVVAIAVFGASGLVVSVAALGGALVTALLIFVLSAGRSTTGYRFVLIGIAIGTAAQAVIGYVITRSDIADAQQALVWLTGSLSRSLWDQLPAVAIALIVLLPFALFSGRTVDTLRLGDDTATALGARVQRDRVALVLLAVALIAVGTSLTGPVAFVAFLAGPIATRMLRSSRLLVPASALMGAAILLAGDFIGQHLIPGVTLPVGVVTGAIGAPYLLWLLARGGRRSAATGGVS
ncbi:iron ABC transporter permease [Planctomonas sp. JC2975]|uniref:iron chelate uptake ABC transporter family permease subunit n=1 Tax=Planctomonas sp. JC2975 TaxID=2729626 RepID=UPI0014749743|nr:iron ABC transporter permease [Planctomonas sp. JC2975]